MGGHEWTTIVLSIFSALIAVTQAFALFILNDIRQRVTRLEDHMMEKD